jgi:hypothetical protein
VSGQNSSDTLGTKDKLKVLGQKTPVVEGR